MEWFAAKHALLAHLPVAAGLLLPLALVAALRPGRGIRPWWTACRYLGWAGLLGLLTSLFSGWALARAQGYLIPGHWLPQGATPDLQRHLLYSAAALPVAVAGLWAMHRPRKEHQGLGVLPLFLGLIWASLVLMAGWTGEQLAHPGPGLARLPLPQPAPAAPVPSRPVPPPVNPEAALPIRALDYAALQPIGTELMKSQAHGGRWIRLWADDAAAAAYRTGSPLPEGSLVVMSSVEDRWGRPGPDPGPLYALEMKGGQPRLTFYWPRVPAARLAETGGQARVYWRSPDPHLDACLACHAGGLLTDPMTRSRWKSPSQPKGAVPPAPKPSTPPAGTGKKPSGVAPGTAPSPGPAMPNQ